MGLIHLCFCFGVVFYGADGNGRLHEGDQLWEVEINKQHEFDSLLELLEGDDLGHQVDLWQAPRDGSPAVLLIFASVLKDTAAALDQHGLHHQVVVPNMASILADWQKPLDNNRGQYIGHKSSVRQKRDTGWDNLSTDIIGKFIQNSEMAEEWLDEVAASSPDLVELIRIPNVTFEGRQLTIAKIGKPAEKGSKPMVWIDAGIHPRELATPPTAMYLIYRLLDDYHSGTSKSMLDDLDWYIVPNINPDGFALFTSGKEAEEAFWRKNTAVYLDYNNTGAGDPVYSRARKQPCRGVDLNRNFPNHWGLIPAYRVHHCSMKFAGPYAGSENETITVMQFLEDRKDVLSAYVSLHTFGQILTGSWAYTTEERPHDAAEMDRVGQKIATAISVAHGRNYTYGIPGDIQYLYSGNSADWVKSALDVTYSYTLELRDRYARPKGYGFHMPEEQLIEVGEETHAGMTVLAQEVMAKWPKPVPDAAQRLALSLGNFLLVFVFLIDRVQCL